YAANLLAEGHFAGCLFALEDAIGAAMVDAPTQNFARRSCPLLSHCVCLRRLRLPQNSFAIRVRPGVLQIVRTAIDGTSNVRRVNRTFLGASVRENRRAAGEEVQQAIIHLLMPRPQFIDFVSQRCGVGALERAALLLQEPEEKIELVLYLCVLLHKPLEC